MVVNIYSPDLLLKVQAVMGGSTTSLDSLLLLEYHEFLQDQLRSLQSDGTNSNNILISEMKLLVNGLLNDNETFASFGYEKLYESGHFTSER